MSDDESPGRRDILREAARMAVGGKADRQDDGSIAIGSQAPITVECPYCGRSEEFDYGMSLAARAWMFGHIDAEHREELPAYEGVGEQ